MKENEIRVDCKIWFYLMAAVGRACEIVEDKILDTEKMEKIFKGINMLRKAGYVQKGDDAIVMDNYCNGDFTIRAKLTIKSVNEISKEEMAAYSNICDCAVIDDEDGPHEMILLLCYDDVYRVEGREKSKERNPFNNKLSR